MKHKWQVTPTEAREIQEQLRHNVIQEDELGVVRHVAGVDVGFPDEATTRAAVAVLSFPELVVVQTAVITQPTNFPYIPGYLSFREIPALLEAIQKLTIQPDLFLCDGQGMAHPRRFGLACHLGVLTDTPAIGVAKTRFIGQHAPVAEEKGCWQPLIDDGEIVGAVLRTQTAVKPLFVSIGHKISLKTAVQYTLQCTPQYRLPETTRQADRLSKMR